MAGEKMKIIGINLNSKLENALISKMDEGIEVELIKITKENGFDNSEKADIVLIDSDDFELEDLIKLIMEISNSPKKYIVLVLGENSSIKWVAGSIKAGSYDYLLKPIDCNKIIGIMEKSLRDKRQKSDAGKTKKHFDEDEIIGTTPEMIEIFKTIGRVSGSNLPILISGEPGSGKELIAKVIHEYSSRDEKPFITVNCSSGTVNTLETELFGGSKNFQIDNSYKIGKLEMANKGTLFLDEIGDMPLEIQLRLNKILIDQADSSKVGSEYKLNVRIIASTSKDLEERIIEGKFSEDLYHTLKVLDLNIPPLKERKDDLTYMINYFLKKFNSELNKNVKGVSKNAMKKLVKYNWPGNVRELKNAIKGAIAICRGDNILIEDLPANVVEAKISKRHGDAQDWVIADWIENEISILKDNSELNFYDKVISRVERELIRQVLEMTNSKKVETAELLGITRNTLRAKMNNYGLE